MQSHKGGACSGIILIAVLFLFPATGGAQAGEGPGCGPAELPATGFFRTQQVGGKWWLVTPEGQRFLSIGVNHIVYNGYDCPRLGFSPYRRAVQELYGDTAGWARVTRERLLSWGINTVGGWSDFPEFPGRPYTVVLNLAQLGGADWQSGKTLDVFDPVWARKVQEYCAKACGPRQDDPDLIGYFTDNELRWGPDWRGLDSLLDLYLKMPESSEGGKIAREFKKKYQQSSRQAELEFAGLVAQKYFAVTTARIREADPNHLILGCRFHALGAPRGVVAAAGKSVDVVSINYYDMMPRLADLLVRFLGNVSMRNWMTEYAELSGKPLLLTEFSYRGLDSGLPNTQGAGSLVLNQAARADRFERYARRSLAAPYVVGYHWFNYMDEPFLGRFDGENGNYGLVSGKDRPYTELVNRMKAINQEACALHNR